jgi:predicted transcriptional regulator
MTLLDYFKRSRLSQAELARQLGVTRFAVNHYLAGKRAPRPDVADKIVALSKGKVTHRDLMHNKTVASPKKRAA